MARQTSRRLRDAETGFKKVLEGYKMANQASRRLKDNE